MTDSTKLKTDNDDRDKMREVYQLINVCEQFEESLKRLKKQIEQDYNLVKLHSKATKRTQFTGLLKDLSGWNDLTTSLIYSLISSLKIHYYPNKEEKLEVFYSAGSGPVNLYFKYNISSNIAAINIIMKDQWTNGLLTPINDIIPGNFVCCCNIRTCFRGLILSVLPMNRLWLYNIDNGYKVIVKKENCYQMNEEFTHLHAATIKCCLTKMEVDEMNWNSDINTIFESILRDSHLKIKIVEKLVKNDLPPTYLVELYAFREEPNVEVNINEWLLMTLIPSLKSANEDYNLEMSYDRLDEYVLDPFIHKPIFIPKALSISQNKEKSCPKKGNNRNNELAVNYALKVLRRDKKRSGALAPGKPPNNWSTPVREKSIVQCTNLVDPIDSDSLCPMFTERGFCYLYNCVKIHDITTIKGKNKRDEPLVQSTNVVDATEDLCRSMSCFCDKQHPETYEEDPLVVTAEDLCPTYPGKGWCYIPNCDKIHELKLLKDVPYEEEEEVVNNPSTFRSLPPSGSKFYIYVTAVPCSNMFYTSFVHPEPNENTDTTETINSALNNRYHELVDVSDPLIFTQKVVAFNYHKSKWMRGVVCAVNGEKVTVFFVDIGTTEMVYRRDIKDMLPEFYWFPNQSVLCLLTDIQAFREKEKAATQYLSSILLNKVIEILVLSSCEQDNTMRVLARTELINDVSSAMCRYGFSYKSDWTFKAFPKI